MQLGFDLRKVDGLIGKNEEKVKEKEQLKQQVMDMIADGKTASEISRALDISVSTRRIRAEFKIKNFFSIHRELLESGVIKIVDFVEWLEQEHFDKEINTILWNHKNLRKINFFRQVYSDEDRDVLKMNLIKRKIADPSEIFFCSDLYIDELVEKLIFELICDMNA